ncbi:multicopper oxidase domain-containing protein [Arthrobacter crystallopoietes]|uniref:multicopper oxidase domain-containing protein n=1 Tax=Crystallibacter crystallopoietes TaxID=37928 RepID=UPI001F118C61|nr:multicopper oxidase domain-containing protein [Arthrobacter crystallopoietes]
MMETLLPGRRLSFQERKAAEKKRKEAAAKKKREQEARRKREAEAKKRAAEAKKKREAEAKKRAAEAKRKADEAKKRREAEAKKRAEEAKRRREEDARRKQEAEEKRRREEEEASKPKPPPTSTTPPPVDKPTEPTEPKDPEDNTGTDPEENTEPTEPDEDPTDGAEPDPAPDPEPEPVPELPVVEAEARHIFDSQVDFSSNQNEQDQPVTEYKMTPNISYKLDFYGTDLKFDDGAEVEMWSFETDDQRKCFPGPLIRPKEGQIFHASFSPSKGNHTIHWHGMEPDPRNDGVGHTSFEIAGDYTYQWQPQKGTPGDADCGTAGTYFYHCHVNTTLHVQMGMFGPLIIDPVEHPDFPVTPGARRAFVDGPEYDIDTEALLIPYSMDTRWHGMNHAAGLSGEDAGLNHFQPKHFYALGGELARRPSGKEKVWSMKSLRANVYKAGDTRKPTLLRLLNANYLPTMLRFQDKSGNPVAMAEVIAHDGRPYRDTHAKDGSSPPCGAAGYPMMTSVLASGSAERYDLLLLPPAAGEYQVVLDFKDWITDEVIGQRIIPLTAS